MITKAGRGHAKMGDNQSINYFEKYELSFPTKTSQTLMLAKHGQQYKNITLIKLAEFCFKGAICKNFG